MQFRLNKESAIEFLFSKCLGFAYLHINYEFKTNLTVEGDPIITYVIHLNLLSRNKLPPLLWDWVLALYMRYRFYVWVSLKSSLIQI